MSPTLAVVVPARDEAAHLRACLDSVLGQHAPVEAYVSDNASSDDTPGILRDQYRPRGVRARRVELMQPTAHFVSSGRWALAASAADYFCFLAADDRWQPGFAETCVGVLERTPRAAMAFPTFIWRGAGDRDRVLDPPRLDDPSSRRRQARALALPDRRELANQLYGVFRRQAFTDLLVAWERGGEGLGVDYASVLHLLARHRSVPVPDAAAVRTVRPGQDLIERAGVTRPSDASPVRLGVTYVRLNGRINTEIGRAMSRVTGRSAALTVPLVQLVRTPQWLAAIPQQLSSRA